MGVESARYEDEAGAETAHDGFDDLLEGETILGVAAARRKGDVHVRALRLAGADLISLAGAGVERVLVGRTVEHVWVVVERVLRAVAVVNVDIDDRDAFQPVVFPCESRRDRDVVQQTEAHRLSRAGVVPGRPHRGEGSARAPGEHRIRCLKTGPGRAPGGRT